jgi:hypothetical protein
MQLARAERAILFSNGRPASTAASASKAHSYQIVLSSRALAGNILLNLSLFGAAPQFETSQTILLPWI